jgi:hypothetical protein
MNLLHALLAPVVFVAPVAAAEVSYRAQIASTSPNAQLEFELPRFRPSFGVLQFVRIDMQVYVSGSIGLENTLPNPATSSLLAAEQLQLVIDVDGGAFGVVTQGTAAVAFPGFDGSVDFRGESGDTLLAMISAQETYIVKSMLERFVATPGDLDLDARLELAGILDVSSGTAVRPSLTYRGNVQVVYVYEPHSAGPPQSANGILRRPRADALDPRTRPELA